MKLTVERLIEVVTYFTGTNANNSDYSIVIGERAEQEADELHRCITEYGDLFHHAKRIKLPGVHENTLEIVPRDIALLFEKVGDVLGDAHAVVMFETWVEAQSIMQSVEDCPPEAEEEPVETEDSDQGEDHG